MSDFPETLHRLETMREMVKQRLSSAIHDANRDEAVRREEELEHLDRSIQRAVDLNRQKRARQYIGDAVYAEMDRWGRVILETTTGDCIILDQETWSNLMRWRKAATSA